jgi:hypothetical protein
MKREAERVSRPLRAEAPPFVPQANPEVDEFGNEVPNGQVPRDDDVVVPRHGEGEGLHDEIGWEVDYASSQQ